MKVLNPPIVLSDPSELFRPEDVTQETGWDFRNYDPDSADPQQKMVFNTYKEMHTHQTTAFVQKKIAEWSKFDKFQSTILDALLLLNSVVDESDPDIALPNIIHAYQTAERIRKCHPDKDWLQFTGLIHDLGKVMTLRGEPQWAVVGDTFPVGCYPGSSVVLRDFTFDDNPDLKDERYNTQLGIYEKNCGLDNVMMSWGHDEYLYRVLKHNKSSLPDEGLNVIRYHSFYPWHTGGDYAFLCNEKDWERLPYIKEFNKFDLYTKKEPIPDIESLKPYYQSLADKFCPGIYEF